MPPQRTAHVSYQLGPGMWANIEYSAFDADGQLVQPPENLGFVFGYGMLLAELEAGLDGKSMGEEFSLTLSPEQAYGERDEAAVIEVDRAEFPPEVAAGDRFEAEDASGNLVLLQVLDVTDEGVVLDRNHPLAGQKVKFLLKITEVRPATRSELARAEAQVNEAAASKMGLISPQRLLRRPTQRYDSADPGKDSN